MDSIVPIIETSSATKGIQTFANKMAELENCFKKRKKKRSKKGNPTKEWFKKTFKTQNFLKKKQRTTEVMFWRYRSIIQHWVGIFIIHFWCLYYGAL